MLLWKLHGWSSLFPHFSTWKQVSKLIQGITLVLKLLTKQDDTDIAEAAIKLYLLEWNFPNLVEEQADNQSNKQSPAYICICVK